MLISHFHDKPTYLFLEIGMLRAFAVATERNGTKRWTKVLMPFVM